MSRPDSPAANVDEPVPTETLAARVQQARALLANDPDDTIVIAYLLNVSVEEVRRVVRASNI